MTKKEINCIDTITTPNTSSFMRLYCFLMGSKSFFINSFLFSPCSGTVISGYSKTLTDKLLMTHLAKDIIPYQKFKKMYKVDTSGDFKGLTKTINNVPN